MADVRAGPCRCTRPQGDNFYVMPAQPLRRGEVSLTVVPAADRLGEFAAAAAPYQRQRRARSPLPRGEGLVMVRAPLKGLAWRGETEALLKRATCTPSSARSSRDRSAHEMRLAVIADVHGNLPALETILADIARRGADLTINLGDCVSGPLWPREAMDLLESSAIPSVRGNHDRWVAETPRERMYPSDAHAFDRLTPEQRRALGALPPQNRA